MKKFKEFINEETMPFAQTEKGFIGVEDAAVRDNINSLIAGVTKSKFLTPYIAFERVSKVLANFHIFPPKQQFLDQDHGIVAVEINQFGSKVGMTNDGEVVTSDSSPYYLYFEYEDDDEGMFEVFSEIVTSDELDEILSETDNEEDEEELDEQVGGPLDKTHKGFRAQTNKLNISELSNKVKLAYVNAASKDKAELNKQLAKDTNTNSKYHDTETSRLKDIALGHQLVANRTKGIARAKATMKEERLDELSKETLGNYVSKSSLRKAQNTQDQGRIDVSHKAGMDLYKDIGKDSRKREKGIALANKKLQKEEKLDEVSKSTLGSYIKKASHDVATRSAATRGFARDSEAYRKNNDITNARKSDERSDKMFKKSWNRRQGIAKAVDKLTKEDTVAEAKDSFSSFVKQKQQKAKTPEKANFNVAKKLARQAVKAQKEKIDKK